jgi:hypothetical protein
MRPSTLYYNGYYRDLQALFWATAPLLKEKFAGAGLA